MNLSEPFSYLSSSGNGFIVVGVINLRYSTSENGPNVLDKCGFGRNAALPLRDKTEDRHWHCSTCLESSTRIPVMSLESVSILLLCRATLTLSLPQDVYGWGQFLHGICLDERFSERETFALRILLHTRMHEKLEFKQDVNWRPSYGHGQG